MMCDGERFRVCGGILVKLGKRCDHGSQPGSWLHHLWFNIWRSKPISKQIAYQNFYN